MLKQITIIALIALSLTTPAYAQTPTSSSATPTQVNENDTTEKSYQDTLDSLLPNQNTLFQGDDNKNQLATGDLEQDVIPRFLRLLILLSGMGITVIFVYVAFRLVIARDDEAQLTNLKNTFTHIVIGTVVILSSFAIILGIIQYFDSLR